MWISIGFLSIFTTIIGLVSLTFRVNNLKDMMILFLVDSCKYLSLRKKQNRQKKSRNKNIRNFLTTISQLLYEVNQTTFF